MAADWIKVRTNLFEDPAVISMADRLGLDEFAVVGRVVRLWSWADSQSRDGHAVGVTRNWLDRYVCHAGFADAMVSVGWLQFQGAEIVFPNFDRHNGQTAKERGLATERQRKKREMLSRPKRDEGVTREEKRREEEDTTASPQPAAPKPKAKTKTRLPDDFAVSADMRAWAGERAPAVDVERESEKFANYWRGKGEARADWGASWRNWMLNAQTYAERDGRGRSGRPAGPDFDDLSWTKDMGGL